MVIINFIDLFILFISFIHQLQLTWRYTLNIIILNFAKFNCYTLRLADNDIDTV